MTAAVKKPTRSAASGTAAKTGPKSLRDFERAIKLFHQKKYSDARERFLAIRENQTEEMVLRDRAGQYLRACDARLAGDGPAPRKVDDLYYLGVIKTNDRATEEAIGILDRALALAPRDDRVIYLLAVNHLRRGDRVQALERLREAIGLRELNRNLARNDPDFEDIREDADFLAVVSQEP